MTEIEQKSFAATLREYAAQVRALAAAARKNMARDRAENDRRKG